MSSLFGVGWAHAEHRWLFLALVGVFALMIRSARIRRQARALLGLEDREFASGRDFEAPVNRTLKNIFYLFGVGFLIFASMGPQWGQKRHPVRAQGLDICFALDLSRSMWAEDQSPSRLEQAKNQLEIFLPRLGGDRAALVGFAGSAYIAAPLSVDNTALSSFMVPMTPEVISDQATNLSVGVQACLRALGLSDIKDRNGIQDEAAKLIVLLSDGEDTADDDTGAIEQAEKLGVPVFSMAFGTARGAPIPIRENGNLLHYVKDPSTGQPVMSRLQEKGLKEISTKTGGRMFYASSGVEVWKSFEASIADYKRQSRDAGTKLDLEDRFQWPLLMAFFCLLFEFLLTETRWRWNFRSLMPMLIVTAGVLKGAPVRAQPGDPRVVWSNNRGVRSFLKKDYSAAHDDFLKSLNRDSADPDLRYNWASNRLYSAQDPAHPDQFKTKEATEARVELENLLREAESQRAPEGAARRSKLSFQLGQAHEMTGHPQEALAQYYQATLAADKILAEKARRSVARLLAVSESPNKNGQSEQSDKGDSGKEQPSEKDKGSGDSQKNPQQEPSQGRKQPKFQGTEVTEEQAKQILESVGAEEKDILKRKARGEAKEQGMKRSREAREKGTAAGRERAW